MHKKGFKWEPLALGTVQNFLIWSTRAWNWSTSAINVTISAIFGFVTLPLIAAFWLLELLLFLWVMYDSYLMIVRAGKKTKKGNSSSD